MRECECKCEQYFVLCNLISIYDGCVVAIVLSGIDPRHAIREESKKFLAKKLDKADKVEYYVM